MTKISDLVKKIQHISTKEYEQLRQQIIGLVTTEELTSDLEQMPFSDIIELLLILDERSFQKLLEKYLNILRTKIENSQPEEIGRLYEGLPKEKRKILSRHLRSDIVKRLSSFSLRDVIKMIYSVVPATREIVLSQYKEIMFRPDFQKLLISDLEAFSEFLSLLPESLRRSLVNKHKNFFLSDEFINKLRETDADTQANILRWFPIDLSREIVRRVKNV